jgi:hypothetical protein
MACPDLLFSSPQLCFLAGVTYRQSDYWDRIGILRPVKAAKGSGSARGYAVWQVMAARVIGLLSASNLSGFALARRAPIAAEVERAYRETGGSFEGRRLEFHQGPLAVVVDLEQVAAGLLERWGSAGWAPAT